MRSRSRTLCQTFSDMSAPTRSSSTFLVGVQFLVGVEFLIGVRLARREIVDVRQRLVRRSSSSRVNERPVLFSGIGPRGRSASFFLALALPPRCGLASGPKLRLPRRLRRRRIERTRRSAERPADRGRRSRHRPAAAPIGPAGPRRTAGSAIFTRARLADGERPSVEDLSVEPLNRLLGVRPLRDIRRTQTRADDRSRDRPAARPATAARRCRSTRAGRLRSCCTTDCRRTDGQPINSLLGSGEVRGKPRKG